MRGKVRRIAPAVAAVVLAVEAIFAVGAGTPASAGLGSPVSLVYLSGFSREARLGLLDRIAGNADVVSPDFFQIQPDGSLANYVDDGLVQAAHDRGLEVVPFIGNDWNREAGRRALENGPALAAQIAGIVSGRNLDGVIVDLENLTVADRGALTAFVQALRNDLPPSKQLAAAVPAIQGPVQSGWVAAYDNQALAALCDYITVMTYDERVQGDPPGPVAGDPWVEQSIRYMLTQIPREKFLLGVPLYGRRWVNGWGGASISYPAISRLVSQIGGEPNYDPVQKTMHYGYSSGAGRVDIYYDNRTTIAAKLSLVAKYGLRGGFAWSLGQEDPSVWGIFRRAMGGGPFPDIFNIGAEPAILKLWEKGWVHGDSDGLFHPNRAVSRAEATAMLVNALRPVPARFAGFSDVPRGHWAYEVIGRAQAAGWVHGVGGGRFEPDRAVTRAEGAAMIAKTLGLSASGGSGFPDLKGSWAEGSVAALRAKGIVAGFPDGLFHPDQPLTRGDMAVMVARAMGLL
ncbi:MAG: S-layer homology domain-containing protein [Kyrpidia tusciae]|nr:S-layer homology domain-containing protein [Kyrpidia tusciae]MBE3551778.1 S-layer homology domain-containing protein [Kyrpidia tusciae]